MSFHSFVYIFDLDGTLADGEHRVHHITGETKDWSAYFSACGDDAPIHSVIGTLKGLYYSGHECWIWTGRSAEVAHQTCEWLAHHVGIWDYATLADWLHDDSPRFLMRRIGDHRNDDVLKAEWFDQLPGPRRQRVAAVFEDRDRVVAMWRAKGLRCFQVAPGGF